MLCCALEVMNWEFCTKLKGTCQIELLLYLATLCHTPYVCLTEADFLLQQGNDTKYSSKLYKNYFKKKQSQDILYNDMARISANELL